MKTHESTRGQILIGATIIVLVLLIVVPLMVQWGQQEAKLSVKEHQTTTSFNLAEGAVDRGLFKLKSGTSTWRNAADGVVIPGYNFDTIYTDVPGGSYRLRFTAGPDTEEVTVFAEARDDRTLQTRAIQAVYTSNSLPGPVLGGGIVEYAGSFEAHWGPMMAQNDIRISGNAKTEYFPRKFSKTVVTGVSGYQRDTNGLAAPNTDNVEWWSDYPVPDLPVLDFTTMRSSAAANGTLNYYTTGGSSGSGKCIGWSGKDRCRTGTSSWSNHQNKHHFFNSHNHAKSKQNLIWYWDDDVIFTGTTGGTGCNRLGLYGVIVSRGNMTINAGDCYAYTGPVPRFAWREYTKLTNSTGDTNALNQYPADNGYRSNRLTFNRGGETWSGGPPAMNTDVGLRGFIYTGGDFTINSVSDMAGTIWVAGDIVNNDTSERVLVFYEGSNPVVPVLNVVVTRVAWEEVSPSTVTW